jgi:hypothetical protein
VQRSVAEERGQVLAWRAFVGLGLPLALLLALGVQDLVQGEVAAAVWPLVVVAAGVVVGLLAHHHARRRARR